LIKSKGFLQALSYLLSISIKLK